MTDTEKYFFCKATFKSYEFPERESVGKGSHRENRHSVLHSNDFRPRKEMDVL